MKEFLFSVLVVCLSLSFSAETRGEIIVENQAVTADISNESLAKTIEKISRQIGIDVEILDVQDYRTTLISDVFHHLPLGEAIERLLNGWNYGLTKDPKTGNIQMLMVVSRRYDTGDSSAPFLSTQVQENSFVKESELRTVFVDTHAEEKVLAREDQVSEEFRLFDEADEAIFRTDDELLEEAPPQVQKFIENMLEQSSNE